MSSFNGDHASSGHGKANYTPRNANLIWSDHQQTQNYSNQQYHTPPPGPPNNMQRPRKPMDSRYINTWAPPPPPGFHDWDCPPPPSPNYPQSPYPPQNDSWAQYQQDPGPQFQPPPPPRGHWNRGRGRGRGRGNYGHQNNSNKRPAFDGQEWPQKKKNKKNKEASLPESCPYYCSACDKGYKMEELYQQHVATHIKCGVDGCPYVAAEKLVEIHQTMQHTNGYAKKIWQLESPEDIEKWKAERKKNFPTRQNIAEKEEKMKDKIARGETLETKHFGKFDRNRRGRRHGNRGGRRGRDNCQGQGQETNPVQDAQRTEQKKTERVDPLSVVLAEDGKTTPQASGPNVVSDPLSKPATPSVTGALGCLGAYGDSSSEEDTQTKTGKDTEKDGANDVKESPQIDSHEEPKTKKHNQKRNKKNQQTTPKVAKRQLSLLEKLLANEIRHERNVILQCVRYIVKNDFFGVKENNNVPKVSEKETKPLPINDTPITFSDTL